MRHGFVKVAAATPDIRVADVEYNTEQICRAIDQAYEKGAKIVAFPELCVTGYTCGIRRSEKDCRAYKRQKHSGVCGNAAYRRRETL